MFWRKTSNNLMVQNWLDDHSIVRRIIKLIKKLKKQK